MPILSFTVADGLIREVRSAEGVRVAYSYSDGRLTGVRTALGSTYTCVYDNDGNLREVTEPDGTITSNEFVDARVIRTTSSDPAGHVSTIRFQYPDETTRVVIGANGRVSTYYLDSNKRLVRRVDPDGREYRIDRDASGRVHTIHHPGGSTELWQYTADGKVISYTDRGGHTFLVGRDPVTGRPTSLERPDGTTTQKIADAHGNITTRTDALGRVTRYTYTSTGKLETLTSPEGHVSRTEFDANGQIETRIAPDAARTTWIRDSLGRVIDTVSSRGYHTRTEYRGNRLVAASIDALGHRTEFVPDSLGRPSVTILPDGTQAEQTWARINGRDRVTSTKDAIGAITTIHHDEAGQGIGQTDPLGRTTTHSLDISGRVTETRFPDGTKTRSFYDSRGLLELQRDALGRETRYVHDSQDRVIEVIAPDGSSTKIRYDVMGRVFETEDAEGHVTRTLYNDAGEVIGRVDALGNSYRFDHDDDGNMIGTTDPLGRRRTMEYDPVGRLVRSVTPLGFVSLRDHDPDGNLEGVTDALGRETRTVFDALNRPVEVIDPLGHSVKRSYDEVGRLKTITDEKGHTWTMGYDDAGRRVSETDPNGRTIRYGYDLAGQLVLKSLEDGATVAYTHDLLGRLRSRTFKTAGGTVESVETFDHDLVGNRILSENESVRIESTHDVMDREATRTIHYKATGVTRRLTFTHDRLGQLSRVEDDTGRRIEYHHDALSRPIQLDHHRPRAGKPSRVETYRMTYDAVGNLRELEYPNRVRTRRDYDDDDRLIRIDHVRVTGKKGRERVHRIASFDLGRDAVGNITTITDERGGAWLYGHDDRDQLVRAEMPLALYKELQKQWRARHRGRSDGGHGVDGGHGNDGGHGSDGGHGGDGGHGSAGGHGSDRGHWSDRGHGGHGEDGDRDGGPGFSFPDDPWMDPPPSRVTRWAFDPAGNRTQEVTEFGTRESTFSPANEILTSGDTVFDHDDRGNMISRTEASGRVDRFGYSVANRMVSYSRESPARGPQWGPLKRVFSPRAQRVEAYAYSPEGERVSVLDEETDELREFLWFGGRVIEEFVAKPVKENHDGGHGAQRRKPRTLDARSYLWAMGQLLGQESRGLKAAGRRGEVSRYKAMRGGAGHALADHLGSIRLLTDENGGVTERTTWGPWGTRLEGGKRSRVGYTGHSLDRESGLHYSVHRYLDSRNGRWLRRDPAGGVDGANLYRYVRNRAVSTFDPTGFKAIPGTHGSLMASWDTVNMTNLTEFNIEGKFRLEFETADPCPFQKLGFIQVTWTLVDGKPYFQGPSVKSISLESGEHVDVLPDRFKKTPYYQEWDGVLQVYSYGMADDPVFRIPWWEGSTFQRFFETIVVDRSQSTAEILGRVSWGDHYLGGVYEKRDVKGIPSLSTSFDPALTKYLVESKNAGSFPELTGFFAK